MSGYCLGEDDDRLQSAEAGFGVVNTRVVFWAFGVFLLKSPVVFAKLTLIYANINTFPNNIAAHQDRMK